ncbi:hypothetical protein AGMMS49944_24290 [Spirochaetia bacterium]|nr:hypothetical protein AGMMS49944_24290 [Spirochaetia bacterium]
MARFLQSHNDFPLMVSLGKKTPSWELNRWGRDALRFVAPDVEEYSLRGDRWKLHYAGDTQSHRFTILDGEHFEYDIILNREPESNRLFLAIEGWEGFDFFRQPDTIGPEHLRGSYAVYKKETVINSPAYHVGTGKMCHIHRPKIIDARGRWVWGDVWIDTGVMALTIPEGWLGDAAYPVVVDPIIGSSTVGAYYEYDYISSDEYNDYLADKAGDPTTKLESYKREYVIELDSTIMLNKYKTPLPLNGTYNTYIYIQSIPKQRTTGTLRYTYRMFSILYSNFNNKPKQLLTYKTTIVNQDANLSSPDNFTPRWIQSNTTPYGTIAANTDVWFGYWGEYGVTRFDYGTPLFQSYGVMMEPDDMKNYNSLYEMAPDYEFDDISDCNDLFYPGKNYNRDPNIYPGSRYDLKASMYLSIPAAYTRTLTQGVKLNDTRKITAVYKKTLAMNGRNTTALGHGSAYVRKHAATVRGTDLLSRVWSVYRKLTMGVTAFAAAGHWGDYIRGLLVDAGSSAGTVRLGNYYRTQKDIAGVAGIPLRSVGFFIKLVTVGFVRDFILRRFLKSNEELVVKSKVCREIILDSKIH